MIPEGSGIYCASDVIPLQHALDIVARSKMSELVASRVSGGDQVSQVNSSVRRSSEIGLLSPDAEHIAGILREHREAIESTVGLSIKYAAKPTLVRYGPGDFFTPHQDNSRTSVANPSVHGRLATYLIYLSSYRQKNLSNNSFSGGRLVLYREFNPFAPVSENPRGFTLAPSAGDLVVFPSAMFHAAEPVASGERWCILGWFYSEAFSKTLRMEVASHGQERTTA